MPDSDTLPVRAARGDDMRLVPVRGTGRRPPLGPASDLSCHLEGSALMNAGPQYPNLGVDLQPSKPHSARFWNYLLGGRTTTRRTRSWVSG